MGDQEKYPVSLCILLLLKSLFPLLKSLFPCLPVPADSEHWKYATPTVPQTAIAAAAKHFSSVHKVSGTRE
ncbi:hypothetical protein HS088_TW15G01143 [Tripterygium wilfordii]|uniref:Uncharacterized protein n=1 Tax=Tripterygium wilfordii TaxID=458696 RepID=A0A7J7CNH0_TRIWF|nr:hypothetical protein HS088_TW15G01143 [Tripterygium wilfordii]